MGSAGRIACIFTPFVLTVCSLICLIFVGLGCTDSHSSTRNNLYFFRWNTQNVTAESQTIQQIESALHELNLENKIDVEQVQDFISQLENNPSRKDFYDIGLWGYCDGSIQNGVTFDTTFCSKPKAEFYFNPLAAWDMDNQETLDELPDEYTKAMNVYRTVSKWMFVAYIVAFAATCIEIFVGFFAILSRWGSFVTTLVSTVACVFTLGASITATVLFVIMKGLVEGGLKVYGITGNLGHNMFAATWLAVLFAVAAWVFWLFSVCCCSGRSPYHKNRNSGSAEKAPYMHS